MIITKVFKTFTVATMVLLQYEQTTTIILARNAILAICALHNLLLFIYHMNHTRSFICGDQKKSFRLLNLSISTLGFLCFYTMYNCLFAWYPVQSQLGCTWIIKIGVTSYALSKVIVYVFIMERLFLIFHQTSYGFSKRQKTMGRIISAVIVITMISICILFTDGTYNSELINCTSDVPLWLLMYGAGFDVTCSMALSVIFSRKLLHINLTIVENTMDSKSPRSMSETTCTNSNENGHGDANPVHDPSGTAVKRINSIDHVNENDATFKILTKSTLLTFIALFSTQLQLSIVGIVGLNAPFSALDSVINGWCCMLMFARYNYIYIKLCGKMEKCITIKCLSCWSCNCCFELQMEMETETGRNTDNHKSTQKEASLNCSKTNTKDLITSDTEHDMEVDIHDDRPVSTSPVASDANEHNHVSNVNLIASDSEATKEVNVNEGTRDSYFFGRK